MATFTDDAAPTPRNRLPQTASYIFQRTYLCSHPDEFIHVGRAPAHAQLTHTLLAEDDYPITKKLVHFNNLRFSLRRCRACAIQARDYHQRQFRARERSLATYQGAVIAGLETAGGKMRDGFQSVLDSFLGSRKVGRKMHGIVEEDEEEEEREGQAQRLRVKTPEGYRRYQSARRVRGSTSETVSGGEEFCVAKRNWDASSETLCSSGAAVQSADGSDASSESVGGSNETKRTDRTKEVHGIDDALSAPSTSTTPTLSTESLPSIPIPSVPFLPLSPSRIPLPRRSSKTSLPRLRGGGTDGCDPSSNKDDRSLRLGASDYQSSSESQQSDLHRSGSRRGWDEDPYEIDDYYFGTYSTSPLRSRRSHDEHVTNPKEPVPAGKTPRTDSAFSLPHEDDQESRDETTACPRGAKRANKARRTGIVLEGHYEIDHMQKIMIPRDSMKADQVVYFGDAPTNCHDSDGANLTGSQEALQVERPHDGDEALGGLQEASRVSPKENMMSLQEALQAHRDFCIDRSSNNAYEDDCDSYNEYSTSLQELMQNDQQHDLDIALGESEGPPLQSRESKASSIVPRGYLLNLKDALSKIAHDGLGDKAHKLSRIYTLQLNFNNSQRDSNRSDSPEFVCQSSSAISASARAKSARSHKATQSTTSCYTSRTMWSSQSTFDLRTPDRRSAATGQRTNSSLSSSRPGSRLSSCPGSRPVSSDTTFTGDTGSATSATQYAKWRARGPRSVRNIGTNGHAVSPAIWISRGVPSPMDINKRLPALPKVKPVLESSKSMECLQRHIW